MSEETEFVTNRQWDTYAKRIERANLKVHGRSLTFSGIASRASHHILDIQTDHDGMIVKKGWRQTMKTEEQAQTLT